MEKKQIEEKSEKLFEMAGSAEGEVDVIKLAKTLGFLVGLTLLPEEEDGFIIADKDTKAIERLTGLRADKVIGINPERDLQTKRFIIAHELGHYILHYEAEASDGMYAHRENKKGKDDKENEADYFAACLLMPCVSFKKKYEELKKKKNSQEDIIILLQNYFNVPKESVERRLIEVVGA